MAEFKHHDALRLAQILLERHGQNASTLARREISVASSSEFDTIAERWIRIAVCLDTLIAEQRPTPQACEQ